METTPPRRVRSWFGIINPTGWTVLAIAVVAGLVASRTHWREATVLAVACLALLVLAVPFLLGRIRVACGAASRAAPRRRGRVGQRPVTVTNLASGRLLPTMLELPVGKALHRYGLPLARRRGQPRGVLHDPHRAPRRDPGRSGDDPAWRPAGPLLPRLRPGPRSRRCWSARGWCRWSRWAPACCATSRACPPTPSRQSDLAFHALREYVPGDDLRHVHWRSSAKAMAAAGRTQLLVRQYLDTRRSHATVVVDDDSPPGPTPRTSRPPWRWRPRSPCAPCSTSSTPPSCAVTRPPREPTATSPSTRSAAPTWDTPAWSSRRSGPRSSPPTPACCSSSPGRGPPSPRCARRRRPSRPRCAASPWWSTPTATSRATEADGMPVLHLADKADLGGLLRWSLSMTVTAPPPVAEAPPTSPPPPADPATDRSSLDALPTRTVVPRGPTRRSSWSSARPP